MKRVLFLAAALLITPLSALAQDTPAAPAAEAELVRSLVDLMLAGDEARLRAHIEANATPAAAARIMGVARDILKEMGSTPHEIGTIESIPLGVAVTLRPKSGGDAVHFLVVLAGTRLGEIARPTRRVW